MRSLAVPIVFLTALGACSSSDSDAPAPDAPSATTTATRVIGEVSSEASAQDLAIIVSSQRSPAAPRSFKQRTTLPSCGEQAGSVASPPKTLAGFACLRSAATGTGGELIVLRRTIEGDPVVTYYRVGPRLHSVEVFTDWSVDHFGPGGWTRETWSMERLHKELGP